MLTRILFLTDICAARKTLVRTGILDMGICNPGEHFLALGKHLLSCRIEIRKHFDGNPSVSHERRNALDNLPVFVFFFFGAQRVTGCDELLNLRILGNQRWIRGLAIHKPEQALDPERLIGVATVDQNFRFRPVCKHAVHLERFFFLFDPPSHRRLRASISGKIFRSDVVLVNVRGYKHLPQARDHGGRPGDVIDGSLQVSEMS